MKSKTSLYLVFSFAFLLALSLVSAVPPFLTNNNLQGLEIRTAGIDTFRANQNYDFPIHIFNISTGLPINSNVTCSMHLYSKSLSHTLILTDSVPDNNWDYSFNVTGKNLSLGQHFMNFQCNSSSLGGATRYDFDVTANGEPYTNLPIAYILIILGTSFLVLSSYRGKVFNSEVWAVFAGVLFMVAGVLTLTVGFNYTDSSTLGGLAFGSILIGIGAVITYYSNSEVFD